MAAAILALSALVFVGAFIVLLEIKRKNLGIWIGSYCVQSLQDFFRKRQPGRDSVTHVLFCMVDHFEPIHDSTREMERQRMQQWLLRYPVLANKHKDSYGRPVQHTWFYPGEDYNDEYLDQLVELCQKGIGEIELHFHHGHDTGESLRAKLDKSLVQFQKHGALITKAVPPQKTYGFIHGNLALDNSIGDASVCGVNNEITILAETGCYADFSLPTAPWVSQTRKINSIYYVTDDPNRAKSHNDGIDVEVGGSPSGHLMLIQGPLTLDWCNRKWGIFPRVDNAEIQDSYPPTTKRVTNWVGQHVHVKGRPEWVFVKVSCHGAEDRNREVMLGQPADDMYSFLESEYKSRPGYRLHYVNARELYNIAKAAEAGMTGDPDIYRDYLIGPYQTHSQV